MLSDAPFWFWPLIGGALIGTSAGLMMLLHGRVAGISGIVGLLATGRTGAEESHWRALFVGGLLLGGLLMSLLSPASFEITLDRSWGALALAGLLVGFGTRLGSGCTSGHGVCGIARFSPRSLVATGSFMVAGMVVVALVQRVFGGQI